MSLLSLLLPKLKVPKQIVSTSWNDRNIILKNGVNLFCWKREKDEQIASYLQSCLDRGVEPIMFTTTIEDLPSNLSAARMQWDPNHDKNADPFWIDVYNLITDFLILSGNDSATVHLKEIANNACTKFHTDGYSLRLFTTYIGLGTEWLPEKATNRRGLGRSNDRIVKDENEIQRMDSMEVGILKGEIPGGNPSIRGIVHRSPEILSTREKRIILRIDV